MPDSLLQPVLLAVIVSAALYTGLVFLEGYVLPMPVVERPPEVLPVVHERKPRSRRRVAAETVGILLLAVGVAGCVFVNTYEPLQANGPAVGLGPLYLGTVPATFGGHDSVDFVAASGGEMRVEFSLVNTGDFPLSVVGLDNPITAYSPAPSWEGTIFQSGTLYPATNASGVTTFHRFEIAGHASVSVVVSLIFACIGLTPTPTPAPGKTPSALAALAAQGYGIESIDQLPIDYQVLGFPRHSLVALPADIGFAAIDMSGCGGSANPHVMPSGLHATPVPSITYPSSPEPKRTCRRLGRVKMPHGCRV